VDPLDRGHLTRLRRLADDARAVALSEHLCWSSSGGVHVHDLLPLPFDPATLVFVGARIDAAQQVLGRQLLIENIARYTTPPRRCRSRRSSRHWRRGLAAACSWISTISM